MVTGVSSTTSTSTTSSTNSLTDTAAMQDRFLKLLVAQINNQDPLNPMDNAQMTTQMAQINTVSGIQQVNDTLQGIATQFVNMQAIQATSLIGKSVLMTGKSLVRDSSTGLASAAFDLANDAQSVKVDILASDGSVLESIDAGAISAGRHSFSWDASAYPNSSGLTYRVTATNGKTAVAATTYTMDKVLAVGVANGTVTLDLQSGTNAPYSKVVATL